MFSFCIHFGFSSSQLDICTLALPFTFSLLIPGSTHPRHPPFVIRRLALLYTARLYSRTHCLTFSPSYLACRYFAVFSLSSNIDFDTSCMLRSSRSPTRLGPCKGCTTASKALLRLQRFRAKLNSLASDPKTCAEDFANLAWNFPARRTLSRPLASAARHHAATLAPAARCTFDPQPPFEPMTELGGTGHDTERDSNDK